MTTSTTPPAREAIDAPATVAAIMEQAQVFASTWSSVGGPFDNGDTLETAEAEKAALRSMVERLTAQLAASRGTDAQILKERELIGAAIQGAMAFGAWGGPAPDTELHWLQPFYDVGARQAQLESSLAAMVGLAEEAIELRAASTDEEDHEMLPTYRAQLEVARNALPGRTAVKPEGSTHG